MLVLAPYIECYISTSKSVAVAEQPPIVSICQGLITQLPTRNIWAHCQLGSFGATLFIVLSTVNTHQYTTWALHKNHAEAKQREMRK